MFHTQCPGSTREPDSLSPISNRIASLFANPSIFLVRSISLALAGVSAGTNLAVG
jgi:hypothetical protein